MDLRSAKLIYFSPTQTTRKIIEGISQGLSVGDVEKVDLTPPDAGMRERHDLRGDLAIIGSPVYVGRLPAAMLSRFRRMKGNGAPAVVVVVYGNRAYEDALLELRDLALEAGFKPIAAGAFVGEHSYSTDEMPIAAGRPDAKDMERAKSFGRSIREKMANIRKSEQSGPLRVPGNFPYKEPQMLYDIAPAIKEPLCTMCKKCISSCPTAAINSDDPAITDKSLCIRCCACIKICSAAAKTMGDPRIKQVAEQLHASFSDRKEPETYL